MLTKITNPEYDSNDRPHPHLEKTVQTLNKLKLHIERGGVEIDGQTLDITCVVGVSRWFPSQEISIGVTLTRTQL